MSPWIHESEEDFDGELAIRPRNSGPAHVLSLGLKFDPSAVAFVELQHCRGLYYHGLSRDEQEALFDDLEREHRYSPATKRVFERIRGWKESSGDPPAQSHEIAVKRALGIQRTPRNVGTEVDDIRGAERTVIQHLHDVSDAYIQSHFGEQITVYRGLSYRPAHVAVQVLDNLDQETYELETTVLDNYTISRRAAADYEPLVVVQELSPDDIAIATDFFFWHKAVEDRNTDGEVQVRGDRVTDVAATDLLIVGTDGQQTPLVDMFRRLASVDGDRLRNDENVDGLLPVLDEFEHDVVAGLIVKMDQENRRVYTDPGRTVLETWCRLLAARANRGDLTELLQGYELEALHYAVESVIDDEVPVYHHEGGRKGVER